MIENDGQLEIVRQQIARLETALDSLASTVRQRSERQYQVLAEGHVDQIKALRDEIDAYLALSAGTNPQPHNAN
jgi:t-SNARE complex subunit (syntaxin)